MGLGFSHPVSLKLQTTIYKSTVFDPIAISRIVLIALVLIVLIFNEDLIYGLKEINACKFSLTEIRETQI